ncbi:MAG: hypothetical protein L3J89_09845 [Gammaproteobacteria bacterium]|nr:hypothetical protein [Gammaproteobacteria bacterium]
MTELGEKSALAKPIKEGRKGKIKVSVRDICSGKRINGATVIVNGKSKKTGSDEDVLFSEESLGIADVKVNKHFEEADYSTFIVHYPRILKSFEAKSTETDTVFIEEDKEAKLRIEMSVYNVFEKIVFHRRKIIWGADEDEDKYGHWWVVVDDKTSFGWWPKYPVGSEENRKMKPPEAPSSLPSDASRMQKIQFKFNKAVYSVKQKMYQLAGDPITQTFMGVEGELNGKYFGGTDTRDAHHVGNDSGDEQYKPVRKDCIEYVEIREKVIAFANNYKSKYSDKWSWRLEGGNHCHTFQKRLMKDCGLGNVKIIK